MSISEATQIEKYPNTTYTGIFVQLEKDGPLIPVNTETLSVNEPGFPVGGIDVVTGKSKPLNGKPVIKSTLETAPDGLPTLPMEYVEELNEVGEIIERIAGTSRCFDLWIALIPCGSLCTIANAFRVEIYEKIKITGTFGRSPQSVWDGTANVLTTTPETTVTGRYSRYYLSQIISSLTTDETENLLSIDGLGHESCDDCNPGYPGANKVLYIGAASDGVAAANVLYTKNGGSTWSVASAQPFAVSEDIGETLVFGINNYNYRVIHFRSTADAGAAPAELGYSNVLYTSDGDISSYTNVTIGSVASEFITGAERIDPTEIVVGTDQENIYSSNSNGESWNLDYTGAGTNNIVAFATAPKSTYWAVGAGNIILRKKNLDGAWGVKTGPSGGGDFTAIQVAENGYIYAGNGTELYRSVDGAESTTGWSSLWNFGASHSVVAIDLTESNSKFTIEVTVDDATPGSGEKWYSIDGGNNFYQVTEKSNQGYNDVYHFTSEQKSITVGDASGGLGVIHELSKQSFDA